MTRTIIQVHVPQNEHWLTEYADLLALCNDGTLWRGTVNKTYADSQRLDQRLQIRWEHIKSEIPQDKRP